MNSEIQFWIGNPAVELMNGRMQSSEYATKLVLCTSIPNSQQPVEFCEFIEEFLEGISELKVLMIESQQCYGIVMQFMEVEQSTQLMNKMNGSRLNEIEEDVCVMRYIEKIYVEDDIGSIFKQPHDKCTICFDSLTELPIISILCGHYFHLKCLLQWNKPLCPLCRFQQQPLEVTYCEVCGNNEQLWMCLTCGSKLCDDHRNVHHHTLYLNINSKLVWDTSSMDYVHRTLLTELGGKIVQHTGQPYKDYTSKLEAFIQEQDLILCTSLESQKLYFQSLFNQTQSQNIKQQQQMGSLNQQIQSQQQEIESLRQQIASTEETFKSNKLTFLSSHQTKVQLEKENNQLSSQINHIVHHNEQQEQARQHELQSTKQLILETQMDIKELEQNLQMREQVKNLNAKDIEGSQMIFLGKPKKKGRR